MRDSTLTAKTRRTRRKRQADRFAASPPHLIPDNDASEPRRGDSGKLRAQALGTSGATEQSPERAEQSVCAALSGLPAMRTLNPGLTPWADLLDPFGVLSECRSVKSSFRCRTGAED